MEELEQRSEEVEASPALDDSDADSDFDEAVEAILKMAEESETDSESDDAGPVANPLDSLLTEVPATEEGPVPDSPEPPAEPPAPVPPEEAVEASGAAESSLPFWQTALTAVRERAASLGSLQIFMIVNVLVLMFVLVRQGSIRGDINRAVRKIGSAPVASLPEKAESSSPDEPRGSEDLHEIELPDLLSQAQKLCEKGEYEKAIARYEKALETAKSAEHRSQCLLGLGECNFGLKKYGPARRYYRELVDEFFLSTHTTFARFRIGECFYEAKQFEDARKHFYAFLVEQGAYEPRDQKLVGEAYYRIGDCLTQQAQELAAASRGQTTEREQ